jgi:Mrp family chromosome partitioning ATPase
MQNPSLHHKFGSMTSQPSPIGGQRIRGLDHLTVVPAADLLKVEQAPLIHSPLQSLIERRRAEFGAIFIDTGAAATSNDYQVAALAAGGALLVTRDGVTRARRASRMLDSCDDAGLSVVGGIMLTA